MLYIVIGIRIIVDAERVFLPAGRYADLPEQLRKIVDHLETVTLLTLHISRRILPHHIIRCGNNNRFFLCAWYCPSCCRVIRIIQLAVFRSHIDGLIRANYNNFHPVIMSFQSGII